MFHVKHGPATQLIARAAALGFDLSTEQSGRLVALVDRLLLEPQNLTAIDDVSQAVDRHLADSLAGLAMPELSGMTLLSRGRLSVQPVEERYWKAILKRLDNG